MDASGRLNLEALREAVKRLAPDYARYADGRLIWEVSEDQALAWEAARLVAEGRVVSTDALVVERGPDGEWLLPARAWHVLNAAAAFGVPTGSKGLLDALAEAAGEVRA